MPSKKQAEREKSGNGNSLDNALLLQTLMAFKKGDFSARMPFDRTGIAGKIADTLNDIIEPNEKIATGVEGISTVVGVEGKLKKRLSLGALPGSWGATTDSVNTLD